MPSRTRQRELARLRARREAERQRARRRRALLVYGSMSVVILAAVAAGAFAISRPTKKHAAQPAPSTAPAPQTTLPPGSARIDAPTAPAKVACGGTEPKRHAHKQYKQAPSSTDVNPDKTYQVTFQTSCGSFTAQLDPVHAPQATASMLFLAQQGFYDSTWFHRIVTSGIHVIQGGDPTGKGSGGPGYQFKDELPKSRDPYLKYSLAMANSGPNTNGSQFFVSTEANPDLPANYTRFGQVISGMAVVDKIAKVPVGGPSGDTPLEAVWVLNVTVKVS